MRLIAYAIDIETYGQPPKDDDALGDLIDSLESVGIHGAATTAGGLAGGVGATFTVDVRTSDATGSVNEAVRRALEAFAAACAKVGIAHDGIARVDVMTDPYFDRWLTQEPERYAGVSEVAALFGVSRQRVAELRRKDGFPAPVAELSAGPVWRVSSLGRFLEEWERRPGRPRKARSA